MARIDLRIKLHHHFFAVSIGTIASIELWQKIDKCSNAAAVQICNAAFVKLAIISSIVLSPSQTQQTVKCGDRAAY